MWKKIEKSNHGKTQKQDFIASKHGPTTGHGSINAMVGQPFSSIVALNIRPTFNTNIALSV